jgi:hypothetical protein
MKIFTAGAQIKSYFVDFCIKSKEDVILYSAKDSLSDKSLLLYHYDERFVHD